MSDADQVRELIHAAVRAADKRGCCNLPGCAFPPRPGESQHVEIMMCDELASAFSARIATLAADLERVTRERDEARYERDSSDGAFRLAVIRADTAEREATAARAGNAEAERLLEQARVALVSYMRGHSPAEIAMEAAGTGNGSPFSLGVRAKLAIDSFLAPRKATPT